MSSVFSQLFGPTLSLFGFTTSAPSPAPAPAAEAGEGAGVVYSAPLPASSPQPPGGQYEGTDEIAVEELSRFLATAPAGESPMVGTGRSTEPETGAGLVPNSWQPVPTDYSFQLLRVLETLAIYNRHVSYAVDNVVTLANTDMELYFSDTVGDKLQKQMRDHLQQAQGRWYEFTGGQASLITDLFAQLATFGVLSAEMVATRRLDGIDYVTKVSPYPIRFRYEPKTGRHIPYQQTTTPSNISGDMSGYRKLNSSTFQYITLRKYKSTPYPVPPFVSALEDLAMESSMLDGFKSMVKRMGMLGFLSVLIAPPAKKPQETDDAFRIRMRNYLENEVRPQVEQGFARGVTIGFEGAHKFQLQGNQMNVEGADRMLNIVKNLVFAGLHQDPNMHGEPQATTETFGRVILAKMTAQVAGYQQIVAAFLEKLYLTELLLAGYNPGYVSVVFKAAMIGDQKRDEEVQALRIKNVTDKRNQGYISQLQAAQELGYDKPDQKEAPKPIPPPNAADTADNKDGTESKGAGNPSADKTAQGNSAGYVPSVAFRQARLSALLGELGAYKPAYDYSVPADCASGPEQGLESYSNADQMERVNLHVRRYQVAVLSRYSRAITKTRVPLRAAIERLPETASQQELQDTVLTALLKNWKRDFVTPVAGLALRHQGRAYREFRQDKTVFTLASGFSRGGSFYSVPAATFGLLDYRAIDFLTAYDSFYLGKFITDEDTRRRILDWVGEQYLGENSPIGKGQAAVTAFLDKYEEQVALEAWKVRRIMETTVNKARNYANLNYIAQAEIEQFEVVEVGDRLTCGHCAHMNGQTLTVSTAVKQMQRVFAATPEDAPDLAPFATSIPLADFQALSADKLQERGISLPSYHSHCRGRVVAVI